MKKKEYSKWQWKWRWNKEMKKWTTNIKIEYEHEKRSNRQHISFLHQNVAETLL